jgi:hypothetical protein
MDFAKDFLVGLRDRVGTERNAPGTPGFDWSGLHARLTAAHAARQALGEVESPRIAALGGFENWQSGCLAGGKNFSAVNPTNSADGKTPAGMIGDIAEQPLVGGRGLK